jgi:hypothetical protein
MIDAGRTNAESPGSGTTSNLLPSRCSVFSTVVAATNEPKQGEYEQLETYSNMHAAALVLQYASCDNAATSTGGHSTVH